MLSLYIARFEEFAFIPDTEWMELAFLLQKVDAVPFLHLIDTSLWHDLFFQLPSRTIYQACVGLHLYPDSFIHQWYGSMSEQEKEIVSHHVKNK